MVKDVDPATTIFCTSKNYVYDTALLPAAVPYGTKGFHHDTERRRRESSLG